MDNGDNWGGFVYSLQQEMTADADSDCPGARTTQNQDEGLEVRAGRLFCCGHFGTRHDSFNRPGVAGAVLQTHLLLIN